MTARSFGIFLRDLQEKYADTWSRVAHSPLTRTKMDLGLESEIVVRMAPLSSREVKVRPKYVRHPKPRVVFFGRPGRLSLVQGSRRERDTSRGIARSLSSSRSSRPAIAHPNGVNETINAKVLVYDVVVMSQSCDLQQEKLDFVLVCPLWSLEQFGEANSYFKSAEGKEQLRRGNVPGYHLVASCEIEDWKRSIRVVDFRTVFALPFEFLKQFVAETPKRLRLLPPYREHLSQAFARFFMRVGLPAEIAPFKK